MMHSWAIDLLSGLEFSPLWATPAATGPIWGKTAFIGVFVLLLVWLLLMPRKLTGEGDVRAPWWRSTRFWAVMVTLAQILVYLRWG
jgi:hypothetical protein